MTDAIPDIRRGRGRPRKDEPPRAPPAPRPRQKPGPKIGKWTFDEKRIVVEGGDAEQEVGHQICYTCGRDDLKSKEMCARRDNKTGRVFITRNCLLCARALTLARVRRHLASSGGVN